MRSKCSILRSTLLAFVAWVGFQAPGTAEDTVDLTAAVPTDPAIKTMATLPNGMRYWIRPNKKPRGSVSLILHVASGSAQETEQQRGYAHFVEHMAFEGSKHFPPGTLTPYFSSLGISHGRHQNASTSYAHTEYSIHMPSFTQESFGRALLFLSDAARDLSFEPDEVEKEKLIVLEEFRYRGGMEGRLWASRAPLLFKGSRYAERQPIGTKAVVSAATPKSLRAYHETWYRPERTTLVVVGDIDPVDAEQAIKKTFGTWKKPSEPAPELDMGRVTARGLHVGVFPDPDQHYTRVTITHARRARPYNTYSNLRRRLVESLAVRMMQARFEFLRRTHAALYARAWMRQRSVVPGLELVECGASGREGNWIACLREVVHEVERVRRYGFTQPEFERVRADLLAQYDTPQKATSADIARGLQRTLAYDRRPIAGAAWERVARASLPYLSARDVTHAFRALFDLDEAAIVLSVSKPEDQRELPNEPEVLSYYKEAREDKLRTWAQRNESLFVDSVLKEDPKPGAIASKSTDKDLGITSLVLKNGIRVNWRRIDTPGKVAVRVRFLGGTLEETSKNLGITDLTFLSLSSDGIGTKRLPPDTITRYLMTRQIDVSCDFDPSRIWYDVRATRADLDDAMRLLWLMLTQPYVHYESLREARKRAYGWRWNARRDVSDMASHLINWNMAGEDPRWRMPDWKAYEKTTEAHAQAWLERIVHTAPIEVGIVGDVEPKLAEELARRWFASLPERPDRLGSLNELRKARSWQGPIKHEEEVETNDPAAVVRLGWRGVGRLEERERSALDHAAHLIDARLFDELRGEHGLAYAVYARYAHDAVEGLSHLAVKVTTDPAKAKKAAAVARKVVTEFLKNGPTEEELQTVERQWRALLDEGKDSPSRWLSRLTTLYLDGRKLKGLQTRLAGLRKADGALMKKTLARVVKDARYCQIISLPVPPKKKDAEDDD